jgi:hypothetical protein
VIDEYLTSQLHHKELVKCKNMKIEKQIKEKQTRTEFNIKETENKITIQNTSYAKSNTKKSNIFNKSKKNMTVKLHNPKNINKSHLNIQPIINNNLVNISDTTNLKLITREIINKESSTITEEKLNMSPQTRFQKLHSVLTYKNVISKMGRDILISGHINRDKNAVLAFREIVFHLILNGTRPSAYMRKTVQTDQETKEMGNLSAGQLAD